MKTNRIVLPVIFSWLAALSSNAAGPAEGNWQAVMATVGQILEETQYTQHKLDVSMGKQILESYLESLDFNKLFFTQEDIDQIQNVYGPSLDDDILLGNLTPARNIFAVFRQRVDERVAKMDDLLKERYGFDDDRTIILNRAKERWPLTASEADGLWRDWLENEWLAAKLNPEAEPEPGSISRHYHEFQSQIDRKKD